MKLSQRKFKKIIKKGWEDMIPLLEDEKKSSANSLWLNCSAVVLFCILYISIFYSPSNSQLLNGLENLNKKTVISYILTINLSEDI